MGALVAAVDRKGENAVPTVVAMLEELTHRGVDAHGIATSSSAITTESIEDIATKNINSSVALGHNLSRIFSKDQPQPIQGDGFTLVFEGRLFPSTNLSDVEQIAEKLGPNPKRNVSHIIENLEGSFAFAVAVSNMIVAGRDMFGTNPLYYGQNDSTCAVASERKALWKLGIRNVKSFLPGHVAVVSAQGLSFKPIKTVVQPPIEDMDIETAAQRLTDLLMKSTRKRVSDLQKVAVAFSGGLDSSVIAVLAKNCEKRVELVSVSLENQPEVEFAETSAEALKLPLHLETYTLKDVKQILPKVLWLIEEPSTVQASIAIPFYWTAENASKLGCNVLLAGQGGDELFGGYHRYLGDYARSGGGAVQKALYRDVAKSYETNFQRDNQVCSFHKVELRLPFMDREVVHLSLGLPLNLKVESAEDGLRKKVLRCVARDLGIPPLIANKTKKAVQYTTGVNKAIQRLAKKRGLGSQEYVRKIFGKVHTV